MLICSFTLLPSYEVAKKLEVSILNIVNGQNNCLFMFHYDNRLKKISFQADFSRKIVIENVTFVSHLIYLCRIILVLKNCEYMYIIFLFF